MGTPATKTVNDYKAARLVEAAARARHEAAQVELNDAYDALFNAQAEVEFHRLNVTAEVADEPKPVKDEVVDVGAESGDAALDEGGG